MNENAMNEVQIWKDIGCLITLKDAAQKNARFIKEADLSFIKNAALVIRSGVIEWIGANENVPLEYLKETKATEKSFSGRTVMPAFLESHTHSIFSGDRSNEFEMRNKGMSYQKIAAEGGGIVSTVKKTRQASEQDLIEKGQKVIDRFVRQGVTTVEVKSGYALNAEGEKKMLTSAGALKKARIVRTFLGAHALPPEFSLAQEYVDHLVIKVLPEIARKKLAERADIFVEKNYFNVEQARQYLQAAKNHGLELTIHADQLTRTGATLLAVDVGAASADHVIELTDQDIQKVAKSEVTCTLLPAADFYLCCNYPRARDLIDEGARVALATDYNPGSSPTQDLAFIGVLARQQMKMSLPEVLVAYTLGAAHALGLQKSLGSIEVGKKADLIALCGDWSELFYHVGYMPIESVYKEGVIL